MTSTEDVEKIVEYLKSKPTGATKEEAESVVQSKLLDGRKLSGYEAWGFIEVTDDGRMRLKDRGRRLARRSDTPPSIYREAIGSVRAYRSAVEWAHHQGFEEIIADDLAAHWYEYNKSDLGTDAETTIRAMVTCFFDLADGAELGNYVRGRSGKPTRLELDRSAILAFIEEGPQEPPWSDAAAEEEPEEEDADEEVPDDEEVDWDEEETPPPPSEEPVDRTEPLRVFISHGQNMDIVDQVKTILELAEIEYEVAVEEETSAIPVPEKVMRAMRRCSAGVICVSVEEGDDVGEDGEWTVNQNVLIEIGAAFVLYEQKVVLLWDRRLDVPSNLQGLYRCEYEGNELSWGAGTKLMKAIRGFKE